MPVYPTTPQITDMMMAAAYTGIALTYESMVCGQINSLSGTNKHCKVRGSREAGLYFAGSG